MRARSRSTTMRTATLCTRPADAAWPRPNTRHSTGDVSQPTMRSSLRRPSCASTSFMSRSRGCSSASRIAFGVISWNTMRFTGTVGCEHLEHVPADRLALAILVGREDELVGALQRRLQLGDDLLLVGGHDVAGVEVVVGVDPARRPCVSFLASGTSSLLRGRSRMCPTLAFTV